MLLSWIQVYPYRCADCQKRFYTRLTPEAADPRAHEDPSTRPTKYRHPDKRRAKWKRRWRKRLELRRARGILLLGFGVAGFLIFLYLGFVCVSALRFE